MGDFLSGLRAGGIRVGAFVKSRDDCLLVLSAFSDTLPKHNLAMAASDRTRGRGWSRSRSWSRSWSRSRSRSRSPRDRAARRSRSRSRDGSRSRSPDHRRRRRHDSSSSSSDGEDDRGGGRRHDSPSSSPSRSRSRSRERAGPEERRGKTERKERKAAKKAEKKRRKREKKERKRERKEEKRAAKKKRSRDPSNDASNPDDGGDANAPHDDDAGKPKRPKGGGLQMRSAEIVAQEKAEREAAEAQRAAESARAAANAEAEAARIAEREKLKAEEAMRAANVDMDHEPVPGFGAAMTLEQYRAMAAGKAYMKGTLHATPKEEKAEMDDKAKKGFWPCQSYKCTKSGSNHMNPKYAEKCTRCGAMKPLGAGSQVFHHGMSEKTYLQNQSKYR